MSQKSFGDNVAFILNTLFHTKLTGWDVDFCIGRYPVRLEPLKQRIIMAETWHNPDWNYDRMVRSLVRHLQDQPDIVMGNWVAIGVRIAVLFGIFAQLRQQGIQEADISVISGDFSAPMSAWYARQWGLPIRNIICCCNENNGIWDLVCHGQMRTDFVSIPTEFPDLDIAIPENLERLIYASGGEVAVVEYLEALRCGKIYRLTDAQRFHLQQQLFVSVISSKRIKSTIPGVYQTHGYLMAPNSALAYAGLLDYRAKSGQTRHAIVLADRNPICDKQLISNILNISVEELKRFI